MKLQLFILALLIIVCTSLPSTAQESITVFNLWKNEVPNAIDNAEYTELVEFDADSVISKVKYVTTPTLTMFKPENPNGTAVVIFPGGGYGHLSMEKEGNQVAKWLNTFGITAFVLKYRLPNDEIMIDKTIGPLQDAQESIRYIKRHAEEWNLSLDKIGVIGFSAGGHLAATLSTHHNKNVYKVTDSTSAKPNFSILVYPVISMTDSIAHQGSKLNLLGADPSETLVNEFSADKQVNPNTPKTLLIHASDDTSVPVEHSFYYYQALKTFNIPVSIYVCENGGHGFGLGRNQEFHVWTKVAEDWLLRD